MSAFIKINISPEANTALETMLTQVNEGFDAGRITKAQLASWIVGHLATQFTPLVPRVQKAHFDELTYLESALKAARRAQKNGEAVDVKALIASLGRPRKVSDAPTETRKEKTDV